MSQNVGAGPTENKELCPLERWLPPLSTYSFLACKNSGLLFTKTYEILKEAGTLKFYISTSNMQMLATNKILCFGVGEEGGEKHIFIDLHHFSGWPLVKVVSSHPLWKSPFLCFP